MNKGFTLVELSIVLVIIGLLVGGILVAQSMITTQKLQSLIREVDQYKIMITLYKERYNALPGDDPKAYNYFGSACGTNDLSTVYGTGGCNGDGDNRWTYGTCCQRGEPEKLLQHLYFAGIMDKNYRNGQINSGGTQFAAGMPNFIPGENMPQSTWSKESGYYFHIASIRLAKSTVGGTSARPTYAVISPVDVSAIDAKIDDRIPTTGSVLGANGTSTTGCVVSGNYGTSKDLNCIVNFVVIDDY